MSRLARRHAYLKSGGAVVDQICCMQHYRAFSLIELVIVVVIVGIIAAIAIPRLSRGTDQLLSLPNAATPPIRSTSY